MSICLTVTVAWCMLIYLFSCSFLPFMCSMQVPPCGSDRVVGKTTIGVVSFAVRTMDHTFEIRFNPKEYKIAFVIDSETWISWPFTVPTENTDGFRSGPGWMELYDPTDNTGFSLHLDALNPFGYEVSAFAIHLPSFLCFFFKYA